MTAESILLFAALVVGSRTIARLCHKHNAWRLISSEIMPTVKATEK